MKKLKVIVTCEIAILVCLLAYTINVSVCLKKQLISTEKSYENLLELVKKINNKHTLTDEEFKIINHL